MSPVDALLCGNDRACRSCLWSDATGCRLARDLDLATVGWSPPALPAGQLRIALA